MFVEKVKGKNIEPVSQNYQRVDDAVTDKLLGVKISFFSSLAGEIEPILREFQTDSPMAPFLYTEFRSLLLNLLCRVLKPEVANNCDPEKVDLNDSANVISGETF